MVKHGAFHQTVRGSRLRAHARTLPPTRENVGNQMPGRIRRHKYVVVLTAVSTVSVLCVNGGAGASSVKKPSTSVVAPQAVVPAAPRQVTAARGARSASLHWVAPAATAGSPILGYVVTAYNHGVLQVSRAVAPRPAALINGLVPGRPVYVPGRGEEPVRIRSAIVTLERRDAGLDARAEYAAPRRRLLSDVAAGGQAADRRELRGAGALFAVGTASRQPAANDRTPPVAGARYGTTPTSTAPSTRSSGRGSTATSPAPPTRSSSGPRASGGSPTKSIRAEAVDETDWHMNNESDYEPRSNGHCALGDRRDPCPTSFGILQIKWYYNPDANRANNSYPMSKNDTAFSLDYTLAWLRGCYEGWEYFGEQGARRPLGVSRRLVFRQLARQRRTRLHRPRPERLPRQTMAALVTAPSRFLTGC